MFAFEYSDTQLKEKIEDPEKHYPEDVRRELPYFLQALERNGEVSGTDYFRGDINKISAKTFYLHYVSDHQKRIVKLIDLKVRSAELLKRNFSITNEWDDSDVIEAIPQCDRPEKLIKALELIASGVTSSYDLGYQLGHRGKKKEYISRHGNYTRQALDVLKLVDSQPDGRKLVPVLTKRGKHIAMSADSQIQNKLLTVAMLNYRPIWMVINATTEGDDEFSQDIIRELVFPEELREADTCSRRSQTIRTWIQWIASTSGIPIRLPGGYKQLHLFSASIAQ
ncbi:MAG: hypothetical protein AB8B99_15530 [Phormidesmis sp.]